MIKISMEWPKTVVTQEGGLVNCIVTVPVEVKTNTVKGRVFGSRKGTSYLILILRNRAVKGRGVIPEVCMCPKLQSTSYDDVSPILGSNK